MATWKSKREQDLRHVFESKDDIHEAASILLAIVGEGNEIVSFNDVVKYKLDIPRDGDVPTAMVKEFVRLQEMVFNDRSDIKQVAEDSGTVLVVVDCRGKPSIRSGWSEPFGFAIRESAAGNAEEAARVQLATGSLRKIIERREADGTLPRAAAESARSLLLGAGSLINDGTGRQ